MGIGLAVSALAALVNYAVARVLLSVGKRYESITLEADARHLLTDVWTSAGVIGGLAAVALTGWQVLDALLAIAVAVNIVCSGYQLLRRSVLGLLDTALPADEQQRIDGILETYKSDGIQFHALMTRQAASRRFVSVHVLVPGEWTVQRGHQLLERLELDLRKALRDATITTHLEPLEDPASFADIGLDREPADCPA
jgi:cation diffusion facilitator family transporter